MDGMRTHFACHWRSSIVASRIGARGASASGSSFRVALNGGGEQGREPAAWGTECCLARRVGSDPAGNERLRVLLDAPNGGTARRDDAARVPERVGGRGGQREGNRDREGDHPGARGDAMSDGDIHDRPPRGYFRKSQIAGLAREAAGGTKGECRPSCPAC